MNPPGVEALLQALHGLPDSFSVPVDFIRHHLDPTYQPDEPDHDLDVTEAGVLLKRKPSTVRGWCHAGKLPGSYRQSNREWRVPRSAIAEYLRRQREPKRKPERVEARGSADLAAWRGDAA